MSHNFEPLKLVPANTTCAECQKALKPKDSAVRCVNCGLVVHAKKCEEKLKKKKCVEKPKSPTSPSVQAQNNTNSNSDEKIDAVEKLSPEEREAIIKEIETETKVKIGILKKPQVDALIFSHMNKSSSKNMKREDATPSGIISKLLNSSFTLKDVQDVSITMRTCTNAFLDQFISNKGVDAFFKMVSRFILGSTFKPTEIPEFEKFIFVILKKLMPSENVIKEIVVNLDYIQYILCIMWFKTVTPQDRVFLVNNILIKAAGNPKENPTLPAKVDVRNIIRASTELKNKRKNRIRFEWLMNLFETDNQDLLKATMTLIETIMKNITNFYLRVDLQNELVCLGLTKFEAKVSDEFGETDDPVMDSYDNAVGVLEKDETRMNAIIDYFNKKDDEANDLVKDDDTFKNAYDMLKDLGLESCFKELLKEAALLSTSDSSSITLSKWMTLECVSRMVMFYELECKKVEGFEPYDDTFDLCGKKVKLRELFEKATIPAKSIVMDADLTKVREKSEMYKNKLEAAKDRLNTRNKDVSKLEESKRQANGQSKILEEALNGAKAKLKGFQDDLAKYQKDLENASKNVVSIGKVNTALPASNASVAKKQEVLPPPGTLAPPPGLAPPGGLAPPPGLEPPGGLAPPPGLAPPGMLPPPAPPGGLAPPGMLPPPGLAPPGGMMPPPGLAPPGGMMPPPGLAPPGGLMPPGMLPPPGLAPPGGMMPPPGMAPPGGMMPPGMLPPPGGLAPPGMMMPPGMMPPPGMGMPGMMPPPGMGMPGMMGGAQKPNSFVMTLPKPKSKVKNFQWQKLNDRQLNGTVFLKMDTLSKIPIDFELMENSFKVIEKVKTETSKEPKKQGPVCILDAKQNQTLTITLKGFKGKTVKEVCMGINKLDNTLFEEPAQIRNLIKAIPSTEEMEPVFAYYKEHNGDESNIGVAEQFAYALCQIKQISVKLDAFASKLEFPVKLSEIRPDMKKVDDACDQIMNSKKFLKLMELVLLIGNYLNHGTARAKCHGFKFNTLGKLSETKTSDNKRTLLAFIAETVETQFKDEVLGWEEEMSAIELAAKVPGAQFEGEIGALTSLFKTIEKSVEKVPEEPDCEFLPVMKAFLLASQSDLDSLKEFFTTMNEKYVKVLGFFVEDTKKPQAPEEFFKPIAAFMKAWRDAVEQNRKMKEAAEKEAKKEAEKKKKAEMAAARKAGGKVDALGDVSVMKKEPVVRKKKVVKRVAEV
ncbi:formin 2,3 and collagen domain containing protein, putative [Entamoeba invadens IP1]|uniref:Formin 2,3 and collagen domain containing protein, putative n=1 Tax=Entamoeba invadens IP1 TaxID=370355 RepID=A0A0A1UDG0_ENTIV|nr:formin 2,3 and collagen domain containing protein, putative [Entamoeba invadens IP1]ELP91851.1 formin 2,3 and collagen domain containing protein, putative [Entamoeba invadens IP1]|eukprot:XP_004258622.1 formin 2,3 and collagen domain containing protein, putative [Entamoeba invadens IP1]